MSRRTLVLAAALLAWRAAPAAADDAAAVAGLERRARDIDERCLASLTPERLAADIGSGSVFDSERGQALEIATENEALAYFKYKAFAGGDPRLCAPFSSYSVRTDARGMTSGDFLCRDLFRRLSFVRGFVHQSPDLKELCFANVVNETPNSPHEKAYRAACDLIVRRDQPPQTLCAQAIALMPFPPKERPKHQRRCVCDFTSMTGREICADDPGNNPLGFLGPKRYDSLYRFSKAWDAQDWKKCEGLELCEALMGRGPEQAAKYARLIAERACPAYDQLDPAWPALAREAQALQARVSDPALATRLRRLMIPSFDVGTGDAGGPRDASSAARPLACPDPSPEAVVDALATGRLLHSEPLLLTLVDHYRCLAYARADPKVCDALKVLPGADRHGYDHWAVCDDQSRDMRLARALIARDPAFGALCRAAAVEGDLRDFKKDDWPRVCDDIWSGISDPAALIARLAPRAADAAVFRKKYAPTLRVLAGDASALAEAGGASTLRRRRLASYLAFRKAWAARDKALCSGDTVCLLMMGGGEELCAESARQASALACGAAAP